MKGDAGFCCGEGQCGAANAAGRTLMTELFQSIPVRQRRTPAIAYGENNMHAVVLWLPGVPVSVIVLSALFWH
jgi:hypothetical protein